MLYCEAEAFAAATYYATVHDITGPPEAAYLNELPDARSVLLPPSSSDLPNASSLSKFDGEVLVSRVERPESCDGIPLLPFPASASVVSAPITAAHGYDRLRLVSR